MRQICLAVTLCLLSALPLRAAPSAQVQGLYSALGMSDVIALMQAEGVEYGDELRAELFPGRGGAAWESLVATLYDTDAMESVALARFDALMQGTDPAPLLAFFETDLGKRIIRLEIEARRAMADPDVEAAAGDALNEMRQNADPRLDQLESFIEANDLIEANVVGAMNSNYAFYTGLMEGDAFGGGMTESQVLSDVWEQEPTIRADTIDWVYSYLALAYQPLNDADVAAYTALSKTEEGAALNRAIFGAFDTMYTTISRGLGQGAARFISGEDL